MTPDDPTCTTDRHGTLTARIYGCTCQITRDAWARYQRGLSWDHLQGRPRRVSSVGVVRRIRALQRLGWTTTDIAARLGTTRSAVKCLLRDKPWVYRSTHDDICRVYDELCMSLPPETREARMVRARAERLKYPAPLAWDDIDNDTAPAEGESYEADPVVVMRLLEGRRIKANRAEREETIRRWVEDGGTKTELCNIHGWEPGRYMVQTRLSLVKEGAA